MIFGLKPSEFDRCAPLDLAGAENAIKYKTFIYLVGSASAEVIADCALCPMEAVKVPLQTQPGFARGLSDGLPKFVKADGVSGLYKGLVPLWGHQIPYTMMKFSSFETIVEMIYKHAIPTPKEQCSKSKQLGVSFAAEYVAGVLCAIVSHPADNIVSFLNNAKGATVGDENMFEVALSPRCWIAFHESLVGCYGAYVVAFSIYMQRPCLFPASVN